MDFNSCANRDGFRIDTHIYVCMYSTHALVTEAILAIYVLAYCYNMTMFCILKYLCLIIFVRDVNLPIL